MSHLIRGVDAFENDIDNNSGYLYTKTTRLSSRMAVQRSLDVVLQQAGFAGKSVLDLACGDGFFTIRFWDSGHPAKMIATDAAFKACREGNVTASHRPIRFLSADAHALPFSSNSFDIVLVQSVLHHDYDPADLVREAFRLAPRIVIHEPNGYNPGLKVIEKVSKYHIEHSEKSYPPRRMIRWIEEAGGKVVSQKYACFVPMFSPDWLARGMKQMEPAIEALPGVRHIGCSLYTVVAEREP